MTRPLPQPDLLTAPFWEHAAKGELAFPQCGDCGRHHFYPRPACPHCGGERLDWQPVSGRGTIYSFSVVHRPPSPAFADDVPYVVAIIRTDEGPHLFSRVVDIAPAAVRTDMRVQVRFDRRLEDIHLPVFAPETEET